MSFLSHISGHKTEVWDFDVIGSEEGFLATGSTDNEIRIWKLLHSQEEMDEEDDTEVGGS